MYQAPIASFKSQSLDNITQHFVYVISLSKARCVGGKNSLCCRLSELIS